MNAGRFNHTRQYTGTRLRAERIGMLNENLFERAAARGGRDGF